MAQTLIIWRSLITSHIFGMDCAVYALILRLVIMVEFQIQYCTYSKRLSHHKMFHERWSVSYKKKEEFAELFFKLFIFAIFLSWAVNIQNCSQLKLYAIWTFRIRTFRRQGCARSEMLTIKTAQIRTVRNQDCWQ